MLTKLLRIEYRIDTLIKDNQTIYVLYYRNLSAGPKERSNWCFHGSISEAEIKEKITQKQYSQWKQGRKNTFIVEKVVKPFYPKKK